MNAAILTTLIPGSVWERPRKGREPSMATVLAISNENVPERHREEHPMQVVFFAHEQGQILNLSVEAFINKRTYQGMNEHADSAISTLMDVLTMDEDGEADASTFENIQLDSNEGASEQGPEESDTLVSPFVYGDMAHPLAQTLAENFVRYTEVLNGEHMQITLGFLLDEMTQEQLEQAFDGHTGFSVVGLVGVTETTNEIPAACWTRTPSRVEIGSAGNTTVYVNLRVNVTQMMSKLLPSEDTPPVTGAEHSSVTREGATTPTTEQQADTTIEYTPTAHEQVQAAQAAALATNEAPV